MSDRSAPILVTGATGYIGGRLVPRLLEKGYPVRCVVRDLRKLDARPWSDAEGVEAVEADVADTEALTEAIRGCRAAYYLVHSMLAAGSDYAERDRRLATSFAEACAAAGVERIIYLGGLGETGGELSEHLASRREVEDALASTGIPVTVMRAAMIIGSGSASFEILRYLVDRLPVMVTPRWVSTRFQPIAVRDVVGYLVDCLEVPETEGATLDIGGPDILSYREAMQVMAEEADLGQRLIVPVPVLTPRLSSLWIHLVTPLSRHIARPLAEGLRNEVICRDDRARRLMPGETLGVREAIRRAVGAHREGAVETAWSDAGRMPGDPDWAGGKVFDDVHRRTADASPEQVFAAVSRLGGNHGYHRGDLLWHLRGFLDRLVGGPGLRRGRRDADELRYGDALDFWRVTAVDPPRHLELRAEMRLPGVATLSFDVKPVEDGRTELVQTARFKPKGLFGLVYWYSVLPMHGLVFDGMLQGVVQEAEARCHP